MPEYSVSRRMKAVHGYASHKVYDPEAFKALALRLKAEGKKLVQCDGVFDLIHPGHLEYLAQAKTFGDVLYVVIVGDAFVRKGPGRPVFDQETRALWLASLSWVDYVVINPDFGPRVLLEEIHPNVLVKGAEYITKPPEGFSGDKGIVEGNGGRVEYVEELAHSSEILQKIYKMF